ncbi:MAG: NUDIX domain-containing protein [Opitutales bacterium]|jgi:NADH pyrophosphatase NudC (nudix superfamily)|nr:NUDIX domain-containing protein [Opitutales bacterium]
MKSAPNHIKFCPSCGDCSIEPQDDVSVLCSTCGFELFFSPATSAAALIEDASGKLLVIKRNKEPSKGAFGLPGGFADPNETLENTLIREVKEEVNLNLVSWSFLGGWPNKYPFKSVIYSVVDTYFTAKVESFDGMDSCQEELQSIHFVDPDKIDPKEWAFPSLQNAIQLYLSQRNRSE